METTNHGMETWVEKTNLFTPPQIGFDRNWVERSKKKQRKENRQFELIIVLFWADLKKKKIKSENEQEKLVSADHHKEVNILISSI